MRKNFTFSNLLVGLMLCLPMLVRAQVIVYEHGYYAGRSQTFGAGNHDMGTLNGVGNDQISSIRVPAGMSVIIYEHANYGGRSVTLTADNPDLSRVNFNDNVSSLRVTGGGSGAGNIPQGDMCWAASSPRGAGTIPNQCPPGQVMDAGLCYEQCRAGYKGVGPVCWASCPSGYRDDGAFCAKPAAYGRGGGYPWKFGDGFNLDKAKKRCEGDNPQGCEKSGEIMYPKCRGNFHATGCCICSPDCPPGFPDIGVSCTKPSYGRGVGKVPTACSDGKQNQGGLCYKPCEAGYKGIGPVCWADACPSVFPTKCAAGCAKSSNACFSSIVNQTVSVLEFAGNIAGLVLTGGGANAAKAGAKTAGKVVAKETIKQTLKRKAKEMGKELAENAAENAASTFFDAQTTGEFSWEDLDPTGIANVVKAFNQPLCKDYR
jgi:hypothetical protein